MLKALLLFFYSLGKSSKTVAKDKGKKRKRIVIGKPYFHLKLDLAYR